MNHLLNHRLLLLFGALILNGTNAVAEPASGSFQQSFTSNESIKLDVDTGSGNITVRDGAAGRIEVTGRIVVKRRLFRRSAAQAEELARRFEENPPVEFAGGQLLVGHISDREFQRNVTISYEIEVPAGTEVKSRSGSGGQDISGLGGPVDASTGSGSITLTDVSGPVEARAGSGRIRAEGIAGDFQAHTGSGSIRLVQIGTGDVVVSLGSGSSELSGIVGSLRAHAGSGNITVEGKLDGPWNLDTGSGSIKIRLPADAAFELDAEASSGDIYTDHPIAVQGRISDRQMSGQVRGGGSLLYVRSGSGNIRIE